MRICAVSSKTCLTRTWAATRCNLPFANHRECARDLRYVRPTRIYEVSRFPFGLKTFDLLPIDCCRRKAGFIKARCLQKAQSLRHERVHDFMRCVTALTEYIQHYGFAVLVRQPGAECLNAIRSAEEQNGTLPQVLQREMSCSK